MYQIIEYLGRKHNITSEGIFRKHGNLRKQQALKERLNKVCYNLNKKRQKLTCAMRALWIEKRYNLKRKNTMK